MHRIRTGGRASIKDRTIPTFARGRASAFRRHQHLHEGALCRERPQGRQYDAAVVGVPFDFGTTYRPGTRFGPQGIRRISALYAIQLRDRRRHPRVDQAVRRGRHLHHCEHRKRLRPDLQGVSHVRSNGVFPIMLGGDHSIGLPGRARHRAVTSKAGRHHPHRPPHRHPGKGYGRADAHDAVVPRDQHPERAAENLVQLGIGGWQAPRPGVTVARRAAPTC